MEAKNSKQLEPLRAAKDSVFRNLFSSKENLLDLYQSLHPEDTETNIEDLTTVTLETVMVKGLYNDLGFMAGNKLLILVEAQSTWSTNILIRGMMYMAQTYQNYFIKCNESLFKTRKVEMPFPEFYVVYTGMQKIKPGLMTLTDEYFGGKEAAIDVRATVVVEDNGTDILNQYIVFAKVFDEQVKLHGRTIEALNKALHICIDRDVLKDYLRQHEEEVVYMMMRYYDQKEAMDDFIASERADAARESAINTTIENFREVGLDDRTIISKLMRKFGLTEIIAQQRVSECVQ